MNWLYAGKHRSGFTIKKCVKLDLPSNLPYDTATGTVNNLTADAKA